MEYFKRNLEFLKLNKSIVKSTHLHRLRIINFLLRNII